MTGTDWASGPYARDIHVCAVCGDERPCFLEMLTSDPYTGAPAGWYCEDDAERLHEVDGLNADQYGLSGADRMRIVQALRRSVRDLDNPRGEASQTLRDLADRLSLPPVRLLP